jgi:hypothetical protein
MSAQLVTIDPYSLLARRKAELLRWLAEEGRFAPDTGRLLELLCDKLAALGIPIARATAHVRTLHPEYRGASRRASFAAWRECHGAGQSARGPVEKFAIVLLVVAANGSLTWLSHYLRP